MRASDLALAGILAAAGLCAAAAPVAPMPRYQHVFVIIEENKSLDDILNKPFTPNITRLAKQYGVATHFYAEVHPSEGNYVAMLGGDTFGIHDDDAYYCTPHDTDQYCSKSNRPGYANHTVPGTSFAEQLQAHGLSWKGYFGSLPKPGAMDVAWPLPGNPQKLPEALYASKHNGFMNFAALRNDPQRAQHIVDLASLDADIAANTLPNFAHIVPNQCDEMHGRDDANTPPDCSKKNKPALIARGDRVTGQLVDKLMHSAAWNSADNTAIIITFDEDSKENVPGQPKGCCGWEPGSLANFGGGNIATVVITNHGPRGLADPTPYSHYSLLRTLEDAFGIGQHLRHANDPGVVDMTPLFAVQK